MQRYFFLSQRHKFAKRISFVIHLQREQIFWLPPASLNDGTLLFLKHYLFLFVFGDLGDIVLHLPPGPLLLQLGHIRESRVVGGVRLLAVGAVGSILAALVLLDGGGRRGSGAVVVGRGKGALGPDLAAVQVEDDGDGDEHGGDAAQDRRGVVDAEAVEHVGREEREAGAAEGPQERVARDGRGREHEVRVDEVVERLQEDGHQPEARQDARRRRHDPVHVVPVAAPAEPEDASREGDAAGDDHGETPLGDGDAIVGGQLSLVPGLVEQDDGTRNELANDHSKERKTRLAGVETVDALEDERISRQEQVEQTVDESHVDRQQGDNGLEKQEPHRPGKVLLEQLLEVDLDFLLLGVNAPVLGASSQLGGLFDQNDRRIRLLQEEEVENEGDPAHNRGDVHGPPPSQIAGHDEASHKRRQKRTGKDGHGEYRNSRATGSIVEHVREDGGYDSQRASSHETGKEATDQESLQIFGDRTGNGEDGEAKHGYDDGQPSALQLGQRRPEGRTSRKAQNVERDSQNANFRADAEFGSDVG